MYRLGCALGWMRARGLRRSLRRVPPGHVGTADPPAVLLLAWGRLGDAILQSGFTARYREWFGGPLVAVARAETAAVLAPHVDRFVPWTDAVCHSAASRARLLAELPPRCRIVLCDAHLFHGGDALAAIAEGVAAEAAFAYAGWAPPATVAPFRRLPRGATVVETLHRPAHCVDPEQRHVFRDLVHYHAAVRAALGLPAVRLEECRPRLPPAAVDRTAPDRFGLGDGAFVACQPSSSQAKKDYPPPSWVRVWAGLPDHRVVLLGSARDRRPQEPPLPCNVLDLRGQTSVPEALGLVAGARCFLGVDSGLAHGAAALRIPTVVAQAASTLGTFFPYPRELAADLTAVSHPDYAACGGCLGICHHEPLWRSRRSGFPCLRHLPPESIVAAVAAALRRPRDAAPAGSAAERR